ncbi:MAG: hypothetical protein ACI32N_02800 [Bulleidia sp.]
MKRLLSLCTLLLCAGCAAKSIVIPDQDAVRLMYRYDRETSETYEVTDGNMIRDIRDALSSITIGKQTAIRTADCDDIFTFITETGSEYTCAFEQHCIVLDHKRYEISGDQPLWKLADTIRKEG